MTKLLYRWVLPQRIWSFWQGTPTKDDPEPYYWSYVGFSPDRGFQGVCTCKGWTFGKVKFCKHNRESYKTLSNKEAVIWLTRDETKEGYFALSSLEKVNKLQNGWAKGTLQAMTGRSRSGKTLFTLQEGMYTQKDTGKNVLLILSEAYDSKFQIEPWVKRLNKRFNTNYETEIWLLDEPNYLQTCFTYTKNTKAVKMKDGKPVMKFHYNIPYIKNNADCKKQKVLAIQLPSLFSLFLIVGTPAIVENTEGGQQRIKPKPEWEMMLFLNTPLGKMVSENNIGFMALDSLSAPLKNIFIGGESSFKGRADAEAMVLSRFDYLARVHEVPCFVLNHLSENPARAGKPKAYGGAMVLYSHKYELEFMGEKEPYFRNVRVPDVKPYTVEIKYIIGDKGVYAL